MDTVTWVADHGHCDMDIITWVGHCDMDIITWGGHCKMDTIT